MQPNETVPWSFLIDEDLPRSLAFTLRAAGYQALDVRDTSLLELLDSAVFAYAQSNGHTLITGDRGFANTLRFPLGSHAGIVVVRLQVDLAAPHVAQPLLSGLGALAGQDLAGMLLIIEPGRLRLSRPTSKESGTVAP
jgi:predicted nuclease of predicted toxin-antitoxin system